MRRARLLSVVALLAGGALALIAATQTWVTVTLTTGGNALFVPGTAAAPAVSALCLAVLAIGGALSISGRIVRYVLAALAAAGGVAIVALSAPVAFGSSVAAVVSTVTAATGIAGLDSVTALVAAMAVSAWPVVAVCCGVWIVVTAVFALATASRWSTAGRRYEAEAAQRPHAEDEKLDAIDSWDELSRGEDPTG